MLAFSASNFTFLEKCDAFCDFNSIPSTCDPTGVSLECADAVTCEVYPTIKAIALPKAWLT